MSFRRLGFFIIATWWVWIRLQLYLSVDSDQWQIFPIDHLEFDSTMKISIYYLHFYSSLTLRTWGFNVVDEERTACSIQR
jgi:hypothetical protein